MKTLTIVRGQRSSLVAALLLAGIVSGCGGNGGGGSTDASAHKRGHLLFTVAWPADSPAQAHLATSPARPKVIPANAQSILVQVKQGATVFTSGVIARPSSTMTFPDLPVGAMSVVATAFASTDGTGNPLATATVATTIVNNVTSTVDVTLASTIDHLVVAPNPYIVGALLSSTINVTGYDSSNAIVLIDPSALSFSSSNSSVASVSSAGVVTGGASVGSATITINESDSGKSLSLPLNVVPAVTVTPSSASVNVRGTTTLVATVVGPTNTSVTWSVLEGSGGTVSNGVYTAPATHGTYHVVATSAADTSRTATATITVTSGGINVGVH